MKYLTLRNNASVGVGVEQGGAIGGQVVGVSLRASLSGGQEETGEDLTLRG